MPRARTTRHNGPVRRLRLRLLICAAVVATAALAGCSDPSPTPDTTEQTTSSSGEPAPSESATASTTQDTTDAAPEPPVYGVGSPTGGAISACVDNLGSPLSMITVLTAIDPITIDDLTVEADGATYDGEILDAFVLPFGGGLGGLTLDDYPPDDPTGEREDAAGYELETGTSVLIGVGLATDEPTDAPLALVVDYTDAAGNTGSVTAPHTLALQDRCAS